MKILLQQLWENNLELDEPVPTQIELTCKNWHREFPELRNHLIARSYFAREDASEATYAGVVYL